MRCAHRSRRAAWILKKIAFSMLFFLALGAAHSQTADQAWLRSVPGNKLIFPIAVRALGTGVLEQSAVAELKRNIGPLAEVGLTARSQEVLSGETVVGTLAEVREAFPDLPVPADLERQGYWIYWNGVRGEHQRLVVAGGDEAGVLYGVFALLRFPSANQNLASQEHQARSEPAMPIRWVDEWDNADGSIERGYAGRSIFFEGGKVRDDLSPVGEYARLLASIGINGCNVNNVNNAAVFLQPDMLKGLAGAADTMRPWGVRVAPRGEIA